VSQFAEYRLHQNLLNICAECIRNSTGNESNMNKQPINTGVLQQIGNWLFIFICLLTTLCPNWSDAKIQRDI